MNVLGLCRRFIISVVLVCILLLANGTAANEKAHNITYYTEIYPPSSYYYNDKLIGLSVDVLKLIWRDQNIPEQAIWVVPWARGYKQISSQPNVALFAMSKTAERAKKFKWVGPLFTVEYFIISQPNASLPVNNIQSVFHKSVAVIRNDVTESLIRDTQFPSKQIVAARNIKDAIALFNAKRVDLLAISRSGLNSAIKQRLIGPKEYQRILLLKSVDDYIAFSLDTPDKIISAFQASLDKLKHAHQALKEEYNLD